MRPRKFYRSLCVALGAVLGAYCPAVGLREYLICGGMDEPARQKADDERPSSKPETTKIGTVRGQVVDAVTGKPAAAVVVILQGTKQSLRGFSVDIRRKCHETRTDDNGEYQFSVIAPAEYNIWAEAEGRTCAALNSIPVVVGQTHRDADLQLVEGSWLEGRVLTLQGQPVSRDPKNGERLQVGLNGPSRPRSGASIAVGPVDDEGHFRVRVPAGRNFPYLLAPEYWERTWRKEKFERGVVVKADRSATVTFRVRDEPAKRLPSSRPARDPLKLPPPVADEWDAAETIRDLGGWYQLDGERHVVEINMVYDDKTGQRYDNKYTDSDEALRIAPAFPRLKRLYLHKGQATDESLACLADLEGLETFFIWDATSVTDVGAKHLANLKNLENIHLSNSLAGDGALKALGRLQKLTRMSLQGNAFTDDGLANLSEMQQLRSLWIGMSKGKITDAGIAHLAGLEELQELDLQRSQITDTGLDHLKGLKNLRSLMLHGAPVTNEGIAGLSEALPDLNVRGGK